MYSVSKKFQTFHFSSQKFCKFSAFSLANFPKKFGKSLEFFFHSTQVRTIFKTKYQLPMHHSSLLQRLVENSSHDFKFAELGPLVLSIAATYSFPVDRKRQPLPYVLCTRVHSRFMQVFGWAFKVITFSLDLNFATFAPFSARF